MPENPNQPRVYDAVLGGQAPPPVNGVVLGGLEGVISRLASSVIEQRIAALSEALKYGEAGLDVVIKALNDESEEVKKATYLLLHCKTDLKVRQALREYNPYAFFECLRTIEGHSSQVCAVAFSPDGQQIASSSHDKTVKVWDLHTGQEICSFSTESNPCAVAFSPDKQILVSSSWDTIIVWDLHKRQQIRTLKGHTDAVVSFAFSPDGQTLISGSQDKTIKVWHPRSGKVRTLVGHNSSVWGFGSVWVSLCPDGQTLISGCSADNKIKIWILKTGKEIRTVVDLGIYGNLSPLAYSPDGHLISIGEDKTLKIWEQKTGREIITLSGHSDIVCSVAFTPDGQTLVSGSRDQTIKIWNLQTGQEIATLRGHSSVVDAIAISPDGKTIVSSSFDYTVKVWGIGSGQSEE